MNHKLDSNLPVVPPVVFHMPCQRHQSKQFYWWHQIALTLQTLFVKKSRLNKRDLNSNALLILRHGRLLNSNNRLQALLYKHLEQTGKGQIRFFDSYQ